MNKLLTFILVTVILFLLMVLSYLLPMLCSFPLWAKVVCIAYQFAFYAAMFVFFIMLAKYSKRKRRMKDADHERDN